MTPATAVLQEMCQPERWSLMPHRNDDPPEYRLALEILERLLPARHRAQLSLGGQPLPADEFPLTMSFIVRAAAVLGVRLGQKHAYRVRREALKILYASAFWKRKSQGGFTLYKLRQDRFAARSSSATPQAHIAEELLSARALCQALLREIFGERAPPERSHP